MWNRKNFLIFALFINCVYFIGTAILITRFMGQHDQNQMNHWIRAGSQAVVDKIILDIRHRNEIAHDLERFDPNDIRGWASTNSITNLVELNENTATNFVGSREKVPFNRTQLKDMEDVGFYKNEDSLNFSYFLRVKEKQFFFTQKIEETDFLPILDAYEMQMTIIEIDSENSAFTLYTTLAKDTAHELLQKTDFNLRRSSPEDIILSKDSYVLNSIDLIPHGPLKQRLHFTKKRNSYQLFKIGDVLIFIWTLFCVSIVLNVVLFKFSDR
jgi:hypothetical protein